MRLKSQPPFTTFQNVGSLFAEAYEPMLRSEGQAKEPLPFTMWAQTDNQRLEGIGAGRTQNVAWIAAKGDTRILLPVMQMLDVQDTNGCLLDAATAKKLFRNANAVGSTVKMGGVEYTVRGIIDRPDWTIVTQLPRESGHILTNITVSGTENTETFLLRHELSAAVTIKSSLYGSLARVLCLLPVFVVIWVGLTLLNRLRSSWRSYPVRCLLLSMGMLAVGTGGLLLLFTVIPHTLIPSQWSDFEFWQTAGNEFMQSVTNFISCAKYRPDLGWLYGVFQSSLGILAAHLVLCLVKTIDGKMVKITVSNRDQWKKCINVADVF
ncbi:ABC transporter permease [Oscillospiraceae bacterium MB08-C2-2]|nr:ABC transporter permease [Oscillospiraceae bacterium MB08-C2-2]